MACSTALAAGGAVGAVGLWPRPVTARQAATVAAASAAQDLPGRVLADFETQHAKSVAAASRRADHAAARARAADATTQIKWGPGYIQGLYGSPCGAWSHEEATGWY